MPISHRRLPAGVWIVAAGVVTLLLVVSSRYGFHRDELYFLAAGRRLDWGYVDQPPFVPLVARLSELAFGLSPSGIRVLPALALGVVAVLSAVVARRFGGGRLAQTASAVAGSGFGYALAVGHLLSTATFDLLFGLTALWLFVRILEGADPRWWLGLGGVVGIGLLNKYLIATVVVAVVIGMLIDRRWELFRSPWPWIGGSVAVVIALPNLVWQATNDWPQIEMARALAARSDGPLAYVVQQVGLLSIVLTVPAGIGLWRLLRSADLRVWRPVGYGLVVAFVVFLFTGGKAYYVAPFYPVVLGAGAMWLEGLSGRRRTSMLVASGLGIVVGSVIALPLVPRDLVRHVDATGELGETIGWEQLIEQVADVVRGLPEDDRADAVIFTGSYGQAGAIEILGSAQDLPQPVSGHNNYWLWGPPASNGPIIAVGPLEDVLRMVCENVEQVGTLTNPWGVENEEAGNPILVCPDPRRPLAAVWDEVRHYN